MSFLYLVLTFFIISFKTQPVEYHYCDAFSPEHNWSVRDAIGHKVFICTNECRQCEVKCDENNCGRTQVTVHSAADNTIIHCEQRGCLRKKTFYCTKTEAPNIGAHQLISEFQTHRFTTCLLECNNIESCTGLVNWTCGSNLCHCQGHSCHAVPLRKPGVIYTTTFGGGGFPTAPLNPAFPTRRYNFGPTFPTHFRNFPTLQSNANSMPGNNQTDSVGVIIGISVVVICFIIICGAGICAALIYNGRNIKKYATLSHYPANSMQTGGYNNDGQYRPTNNQSHIIEERDSHRSHNSQNNAHNADRNKMHSTPYAEPSQSGNENEY